jgi:hypothetical protein
MKALRVIVTPFFISAAIPSSPCRVLFATRSTPLVTSVWFGIYICNAPVQ